MGGRPLRIGFLCAGYWPDVGGIESHVQDLARRLAPRGHALHAMALTYADAEPFSLVESEVEGVVVTRVAYRYHDHDALAVLARHPRMEERVEEWVRAKALDLVHVHHVTGFGVGALRAIARAGKPSVMTLHDYWTLCPRGQMLRADGAVCEAPEDATCGACLAGTWPHLMPSRDGRAEGPTGQRVESDAEAARARTDFALACLELPARLLTPSAAARRVFERAGVPPGRIRVVANGVEVGDLARDVAAARAAGARGEGVALGVLGTVLPSKGVLELAEAFAEASVPGLSLHVHGNLPPYHGDDSYVARLRELEARVAGLVVHGPFAREELAGILAGLDVVAAPSRWEEVFGLTVREARAAGLAVLVSDAGDLPTIAGGVGSDAVVARDDRAAWVAALRRVGSDPERLASLAASPHEPRSTADMADELEAIYLDAAGA